MSLFLIKRFLLPFLICSVALSCRRYHEPIEIAKAEAYIHTNPQLSRNLLDNVEKYMQDNAPQLERTHYELLSIQANDKLRVPQPNDSAISRIVNFFEQSKQNRYVNDLMLAYYYKGSFFRDRHDVPRAVKFYLKAINSADTAAVDFDYDAYCAILTQLGYLYSDECMKEEHLAMAQRSFSYRERCKDVIPMLADLAYAYDLNNEVDSAKKYYNDFFESIKSNQALLESYKMAIARIISFFRKQGDTKRAIEIFAYYKSDKSSLYDNFVIGDYMRMKGYLDSAIYYYTPATRSDRLWMSCAALREIANVYADKGDIAKAAHYALLCISKYEKLHEEMNMESVARMKSLYDYSIHEEQAALERARRVNMTWYAIAGGLFILLLSSFVAIFLILRKRRLENKLRLQQIEIAREKEVQKKLEESLLTESEKNRRLRHDLNIAKTVQDKTRLKRSEVCGLIKTKAARGEELTNSEWDEFDELIESIWPNLCELLKKEFHISSNIQQRICTLILLGFNGKDIRSLLNNSRQSYHGKCRRILYKLTHTSQATEMVKESDHPAVEIQLAEALNDFVRETYGTET